jgi:hypothetical protein
MEHFWVGFEKRASVMKGLLEGLIGAGELTGESIARRAGKGIRRSVLPATAATGGVIAGKKLEEKKAADMGMPQGVGPKATSVNWKPQGISATPMKPIITPHSGQGGGMMSNIAKRLSSLHPPRMPRA